MAWVSFYVVGWGGLNDAQQRNNGNMFWAAMRNYGFTACAAAAIWSNILHESGGNPQAWETGSTKNGFGLVQWTEATKLIDWARGLGLDPNSGDVQCLRINNEFKNPSAYGSQYYINPFFNFNASASDFINAQISASRSIEWWSECFTRNYERPNERNFQERKEAQFASARTYYQIFSGQTPDPPTPPTPPTGYYSITMQQSGNGSIDVTPWKPNGYAAGESVTLQIRASSGWKIKQINSDPELNLTHSGQTFKMPSANVTIFAIFEEEEIPEKEVLIALRLVENNSLELRINGEYKRWLPNNFNTFEFRLKGENLL